MALPAFPAAVGGYTPSKADAEEAPGQLSADVNVYLSGIEEGRCTQSGQSAADRLAALVGGSSFQEQQSSALPIVQNLVAIAVRGWTDGQALHEVKTICQSPSPAFVTPCCPGGKSPPAAVLRALCQLSALGKPWTDAITSARALPLVFDVIAMSPHSKDCENVLVALEQVAATLDNVSNCNPEVAGSPGFLDRAVGACTLLHGVWSPASHRVASAYHPAARAWAAAAFRRGVRHAAAAGVLEYFCAEDSGYFACPRRTDVMRALLGSVERAVARSRTRRNKALKAVPLTPEQMSVDSQSQLRMLERLAGHPDLGVVASVTRIVRLLLRAPCYPNFPPASRQWLLPSVVPSIRRLTEHPDAGVRQEGCGLLLDFSTSLRHEHNSSDVVSC